MSQINKPINIPTSKNEDYNVTNNFFDPIQNSPPNIFMSHLKYRISKSENTKKTSFKPYKQPEKNDITKNK